MTKAIVFCADGTWNGPDDHSDGVTGRTNVYKLFANLAGSEASDPHLLEQERSFTNEGGKQVQVAKYLHGVGNSDNPIVRLVGGSMGAGLIERIVRGFTFISRNYLQGDRIYITGFSRGAYTARALAGMISSRGLLDATEVDLSDKSHAYRLGLACWYEYRQLANESGGLLGTLRGLFDRLILPYLDKVGDKLLSHVPVEAVAVWDTVGSLGVPLYLGNQSLDVFQFADLRLSPAVRTGLHAVALDEMRANFHPTLWDPDPRVTQVLFAGAHADVGGGYDECGLSDVSLDWMTRRLAALGVSFAADPAVPTRADPYGASHTPWTDLMWHGMPHGARTFPAHLRIKQDVISRRDYQGPPADTGGLEGKSVPWAAYQPLNQHCFGAGSIPADGVIIEP